MASRKRKERSSFLGRIRLRRATGVVMDGSRLVATTVAITPGGFRPLGTTSVSLDDQGIGEALRELTAQGALVGSVVVGLRSADVFYNSARCEDEDAKSDHLVPAALGLEASAAGLLRETVIHKSKGGCFESAVVCRKRLAEGLLVGLSDLPSSRACLEPTPLAVYRLARARTKVPRKWRTWVHVLLEGTEGLAILVHRGHPLAWRVLTSAEGGEIYAVVGVLMGFLAHAKANLGFDRIDGILLHGREHDGLAARCREHFEIEARVAPAIGLDAETAAFAHAAGALRSGPRLVNLFHALRPSRANLHGFPRITAAALALVVAGSSWMLWDEANRLERKAVATAGRARKSAKVAGVKPKDLKKRHKLLGTTLAEAQVFIDSRIYWAPVLRELPDLLPPTVVVVSLLCDNKLPLKDMRTGKRVRKDQMSIGFEVRVGREESFPREPREVIFALSNSPVFTRYFDDFEGGSVRRVRAPGGQHDLASFVVTCRKAVGQP